MKSFYAIVFISIVLVGWIHAAPKLTNSQEQRTNYLEALFRDDNRVDDEYIDDDYNDDDNMDDEYINDDKMEDEYFDDANMEDDQFGDGNFDEKKNYDREWCVKENGQGCWQDKHCCDKSLKCRFECAMCNGVCKP